MGEVQLDPRASSRTTTCRLDSSFSTTSTVVAISSTISRQQAGGHGSGKSHCSRDHRDGNPMTRAWPYPARPRAQETPASYRGVSRAIPASHYPFGVEIEREV